MLNDSIDNLRIDLNRSKVQQSISVRAGDTKTRTIHVSITNNGNLYPLDNILFAEILIKKPDDKECDQSMIISGNELHYTFRTQDINVVGQSKCQIMLTGKDGSVVTTPEFNLVVFTKVLDQHLQESENEYGAITAQLAEAYQYAKAAEDSKIEAGNYAFIAEENAKICEEAKENIQDNKIMMEEYKNIVDQAKEEAIQASTLAETYATLAMASEDVSKGYKEAADVSAASAASDAESANEFADQAEQYMNATSDYMAATYEYAADAAQKAANANLEANLSKSYAVGTDDQVREHDSIDNSKYYYEKTRAIAEGSNGVVPMGSILFANLPDDALTGWMYNILNNFTTTEDFLEGAGEYHVAGTNVVKTASGKWDCMAGSTSKMDSSLNIVTFTEASTRENVESGDEHRTILAKIKKFFADLKAVAFSGDYQDLNNTPDIPSKVSDLTNDSNYVTSSELSEVVESQNEHLSTLDESVESLQDKIGNHENLLDNPWFTVNQRGFSSKIGTTAVFTFDRWVGNHGYLAEDKIPQFQPSEFIIQRLECNLKKFLEGKDVTVSVQYRDGTIDTTTFTYLGNNNSDLVFIMSRGAITIFGTNNATINIGGFAFTASVLCNVRSIKLELGTVSTIANDTLPNYELEKYKCTMSTADSSDTYANGGMIKGTLSAGATSITLTDSRITTNSIFRFFTSKFGVSPTACTVNSGAVILTFEKQTEPITVGVKLE